MELPIIAYGYGSTRVFGSLDEAERALDVAEVERGTYMLFDGHGHLLQATVAGDGAVRIRPADAATSFAPQVRMRLMRKLTHLGVPETSLRDASLRELVARALGYETKS